MPDAEISGKYEDTKKTQLVPSMSLQSKQEADAYTANANTRKKETMLK